MVLGVPNSEPWGVARRDAYNLPTDEELDAEFAKVAEQNKIVRAYILCQPDNPTRIVFREHDLLRFVAYMRRKNVILVSDEVYGGQIFNNHPSQATEFFSLRDYADVTLWGLSKDFGSSGFRCGIIHCRNEKIKGAYLNFCITVSFLYILMLSFHH